MLIILLILGVSSTLTLIITLIIWSLFNKKNKKVIEINSLIDEIWIDISKIKNDVGALYGLVLEISQSIFRVQVIDINSQEITEEDIN